MKTLKSVIKESILEKLSIDSIMSDAEFPADGTLEEIIEFLKEQDFKDVSKRGPKDIIFNSKKSKCFIYIKELGKLWFADTSKENISKDNPIFTIKFIKDIKKVSNYLYSIYYLIDREVTYIVKEDKKAFIEELNKHFYWQ